MVYERVFAVPDQIALTEYLIANTELEARERKKILKHCANARRHYQADSLDLARHEVRQIENWRDEKIINRVMAQYARDEKKRNVMAANRDERLKSIRKKHSQWKAEADAIKGRHPDWSRLAVARQVQKDLGLKKSVRAIERAIKK